MIRSRTMDPTFRHARGRLCHKVVWRTRPRGRTNGQASISDLVLLPVLGVVVLLAAARIVHHAYAPPTAPLRLLPKNIRREVLALQSPDVATRRAAATQLMLNSLISGENLAPAAPMLIEALKDEDEDVRETVAVTLRNVGREAVPALAAALGEPGPLPFRMAVIQVLGGMGGAAWEALPALMVAAAQDPYEAVRRAAVTASNAIVGDRARSRRRGS